MIQVIDNKAYVKITPTQWVRGRSEACYISVAIVYDDNFSKATLFYSAYDSEVIEIDGANGNIDISGSEYTKWDGSPESTFEYAINMLGLSIEQ